VAGVATRVNARTLEYDSCPVAMAAEIAGSASSARATRTFSRAAPRSMLYQMYALNYKKAEIQ
jgi:hypothetical protein